MPVSVFFEGEQPPAVKAAGRLLARAAALGLGRNAARAVNLVLTDGTGIRTLNRRFLAKDRLTDVIAFNFPPSPLPGASWGEVYVCVPVAARQAKAMGHSLLTELLVLTAHGALHLAGMDDRTPALRRRMNERTAALLKKL
ncbi:MAG: rRNA maturation RNase YbeY [Elusimicrobia bacterium GWC2_61_19]|nr:MAG: rRNA maturation RNase YbeY [Elusimicrobia bacterium GWC2_61_19]